MSAPMLCCMGAQGKCKFGDACHHSHVDDGVSPCTNAGRACRMHASRNGGVAAALVPAAQPRPPSLADAVAMVEAEASALSYEAQAALKQMAACCLGAVAHGGGAPAQLVAIQHRVIPVPKLPPAPAFAPIQPVHSAEHAAGPMCCMWSQGKCRFGGECRTRHDDDGVSPCTNAARECRLHSHRNEAPPPPAPTRALPSVRFAPYDVQHGAPIRGGGPLRPYGEAPIRAVPARRAGQPRAAAADTAGAVMCCMWVQGKCKFGDECRTLHDDDGVSPCTNAARGCRMHAARNGADVV